MRGVNLPQTFERRGTTVPFQQRDLAHARVREYFHGKERQLEAVLPNFSGTRRGEQLVLPWPQLTDMSSLNARDAVVHEEVMATLSTRDLDPIAIREICISADAQFAVDTESRNLARKKAEQEDEDRMMVRLSCIAELTRECGIAMGDKLMSRTDTQTLLDLMSGETSRTKIDLDLLIERVMIFAAERSGTTVADAKAYLDPLVGMITPFGNVTARGETKSNGFLYLQHTDLITFRAQVAEVQPTVREELETSMVLILEAADECIGYVNERLAELNGMLGKLADMFDRNMSAIDRLDRLRRDVAYGLDGWVDMIRLWDEAFVAREAIGGEIAMERAINRISGYAPRIPVKELYPDHELVKKGSEYERARVRNVSQMHAWENDKLDSELADRVEKGKERESGRKLWKSPEDAEKEAAERDAEKRQAMIKKATESTPKG
jgi:hypothetical protein